MIKVYKKNIIEGLEDLSSYEFQKIAWFENNQGLCSSYSDDVSAVFEDTGLEYAFDQGAIVFGAEADAVLRDLNTAVEAIGYNRDEAELIDSPEMQGIREKAAKALALVKTSTGEDSMVEIVE